MKQNLTENYKDSLGKGRAGSSLFQEPKSCAWLCPKTQEMNLTQKELDEYHDIVEWEET